MVNHSDAAIDLAFSALADGTRRAMVAALATRGELTVSALARPFPISLPAVLKHLGILDAAGLVTREKRGRAVYCRLEPQRLGEARAWLARYEQFWNAGLDRLEHYLEETPCPQPKPARSRTRSSSSANSAPRRKRSGARGPSRRR